MLDDLKRMIPEASRRGKKSSQIQKFFLRITAATSAGNTLPLP